MVVRLPTHICVTRPQWVNWKTTLNANWRASYNCLHILWLFWQLAWFELNWTAVIEKCNCNITEVAEVFTSKPPRPYNMHKSSSFYWYGLTFIPAWISNHMSSKVWDKITYPFLNFNDCTRWGLGMDKQFHPAIYNRCNYLSMCGLKLYHVSERGPRTQLFIITNFSIML